jgi:hypothetical protein
MNTMKNILLTLVTMAALGAVSAPALAFKCGSGAGGSCACQGRVDCKDMRRSEMCKGDLTCGKGKCTCTAALLTPADDVAEGKGRLKGVLGKKSELSSQ